MSNVELTIAQKKIIIEYMLGGVSKGIFEDCPEFFEGLSEEQIDERFSEYRNEAEKFVDEIKYHVLQLI